MRRSCSPIKRCMWHLAATAFGLCGMAGSAFAEAPLVYKNAFRQSPVRAEPGDLLLLAGSGFASGDRVVYELVKDTTKVHSHPPNIPSNTIAIRGEATVVSSATDALTIRLPDVMRANQSYVFWVTNTATEWSSGLLINDARPLWISPERVFASQTFGGLPRKLKVVGRNLQPATGSATHVRLKKTSGSAVTYDLIAENDNVGATAIERYAAIVTLPWSMTAATYSVEVSRDGKSWVPLAGQSLVVAANPLPLTEFSTGVPCRSDVNPGCDDTGAVSAAIAAAAAHPGGGTVVLGAGTWKLGASGAPAPDQTYGLILPAGVSIRGIIGLTTVQRGPSWNAPALFTLLGSNEVKNIYFKDAVVHVLADQANKSDESFLQLGRWSSSTSWGDPTVIDTVMINGNTFDNGINGVRDGGFPIRHLYIANNVFAGWYNGIRFAGPYSPNRNQARFNLEDSVISGNTFRPGGYDAPTIGQGSIASEIGAAYRLDFSENVADGHATDFIHGATPGFRAAFFQHMSNDHEMVLFAKNRGYCTGDRAGDGEFMVYDTNDNTFGFTTAVNVVTATSTTATVEGTLQVTSPTNYFANHWVQVVAGTGIGQARKIASYTAETGQVVFTVSPEWDVPPTSSSRITVSREVWQSYIVDNTVDNTGCTLNENHSDWVKRPESGLIGAWATMADSAIEGNVQTGTGGIVLQMSYNIAPEVVDQNLKQFVEVRGNTVHGEVNYDSYCSFSGIIVNYGCSENAPAPVLGYGLSIGRNTVDHADGLRGGAIVAEDGYYTSQNGYPMLVNMLIHNNAIQDLGNTPPTTGNTPTACDEAYPHPRGIHLHKYSYTPTGHAIERTVLLGNSYPADLVCQFLDDGMTATVNLDTPPVGGWCPAP